MWIWINNNSGGVQAVGSVIAILIAVGLAWLAHALDLRRSKNANRQEDLRALETVASIVIYAMNLIQGAKDGVCDKDGPKMMGYFERAYDQSAFIRAAEALREIPIARLPNFEVVKPVLEMRDLTLRANKVLEGCCQTNANQSPN